MSSRSYFESRGRSTGELAARPVAPADPLAFKILALVRGWRLHTLSISKNSLGLGAALAYPFNLKVFISVGEV
jgi:hypothetical protein